MSLGKFYASGQKGRLLGVRQPRSFSPMAEIVAEKDKAQESINGIELTGAHGLNPAASGVRHWQIQCAIRQSNHTTHSELATRNKSQITNQMSKRFFMAQIPAR